jgi:uncharacterized membrane protein (UPF0127 family)
MRIATIKNRTRGTIVGERVEIANTSFTRLWGLLGRSGLGAGGGLWIKPSSGVHTFGMKFAIDVVGLDKNLRVVKIWPDLVPFRITSVSLRISSVIELAAGRINECSIQVGDVLEVAGLGS